MKNWLLIFLFSCLLPFIVTAQNTDTNNAKSLNKTISITVMPKKNWDPKDLQGLIESSLLENGFNVISSEVAQSIISNKTQVVSDTSKINIDNEKTRTLNVNSTYVLSFDYDYTYGIGSAIRLTSFNARVIDLSNGGKIVFSKSLKGSPKKVIGELINYLEN